MATEITYLELSEATGSAHKFYEVSVTDTELKIRYGRIGDPGATQISHFATEAAAQAAGQKKLREKLKSGYAPAVLGVRKKRTITQRVVIPTALSSTGGSRGRGARGSSVPAAPVLWRFGFGSMAFGIFVDSERCWVGKQNGQIYALDHRGAVRGQFALPAGVKCLVADADWIYAGCDDGNVYDLTGKIPRVAYAIAEDVDIYWIDIHHGMLGVADAGGRIALFNHEDESQWMQKSKGKSGWMVRCDDSGIYHGHSAGVTKYTPGGELAWHQRTGGVVLFGWQESATVYAGTGNGKVYAFSKTGRPGTVYDCDDSIYSCAAADDGRYVFAGDAYSAVYCFAADGTRLWKLDTGCGPALSMQYHDGRLYVVTSQGTLACIDASAAAIAAAQTGTVPQATKLTAPAAVAPVASTTLAQTHSAGGGVVLECFREGGALRMRVVSPGYDPAKRVQFPKDIRRAGARYVVAEVRPVAQGDFYRAYGDIEELV